MSNEMFCGLCTVSLISYKIGLRRHYTYKVYISYKYRKRNMLIELLKRKQITVNFDHSSLSNKGSVLSDLWFEEGVFYARTAKWLDLAVVEMFEAIVSLQLSALHDPDLYSSLCARGVVPYVVGWHCLYITALHSNAAWKYIAYAVACIPAPFPRPSFLFPPTALLPFVQDGLLTMHLLHNMFFPCREVE